MIINPGIEKVRDSQSKDTGENAQWADMDQMHGESGLAGGHVTEKAQA